MTGRAPRLFASERGGAGLAAVWLLWALHAALYPFATLIVDSGRDLANGLAIASGAGLPDYGPALFGVWHLGPAWYALLALPLWLFGSVGATALFVGVLAALKIPLAYALGHRLGDRTLGLFCALFAALPGWQILGALVLSHTALVETLLYATFLCCVCAVQRRQPAFAALAALLLALALHAHPTALLGAPAVAWALWRGAPRQRAAWLGIAALAFVLPFVPMLLAEARSGWPQLGGTGRYLGDSDLLARAVRLPQVLWGSGWNASVFVRDFLLQRVPGTGWAWQVGSAIGWLGALAGVAVALRDRDLRPAAALLAWIGGVLFVCVLRDTTPAWMTYAVAPLQTLAWALGWHALLRPPRRRARLVHALAVPVCMVALLLLADRVAVWRSGLQAVPGASVADVAEAPTREPPSRFWLSAVGHDAVARRLCAEPASVALHGDLAAAFDFGQGVAARLHCSDGLLPRLGGVAGAQHLAGVPSAVATALHIDGEPLAGFVLRAPARVLFPPEGRIAVADTVYRATAMAALAKQGERSESLRADCAPGEMLVVTNRLPELNPVHIRARDAAGERDPVLTQLASRYYACDGAPIELLLRALDAPSLDVFVLPLNADAAR
ncbi:hypothetical protein [Chiayiivirga flava]|uniref:Glycosyltransferase RgtA/B/C/D-like domain-containing protein n=1 Tax=Chiayiivirga flava TaxID=659595 RepID=A0A7W8G036_9GAMM|nr:hypothetical protein [Chiayiivirga flava]MBB5207849.1 hypothetical protein [Chiayiivirga flava]